MGKFKLTFTDGGKRVTLQADTQWDLYILLAHHAAVRQREVRPLFEKQKAPVNEAARAKLKRKG